MLAAMMGGAANRYANTVDLISVNTWTVPAGLTLVYVNAQTPGAGPYYTDTVNNQSYVGGGGGGAAIINAPLTVAPGDQFTYSATFGFGSSGITYTVNKNGAFCFFIQTGQAGNLGGYTFGQAGGYGGGVNWGPTSQTANGGDYGTSTNPGGNGSRIALTGGGVIISGGGGGAGGTVVPFAAGTAGGNAGDYTGSASVNGFGGGGGGFNTGSGQTLLIANGGPAFVPGSNGPTASILFQYN